MGAVSLALLLGACGGTSPAREDAAAGAEPEVAAAPQVAAALPDACGLLDPDAVVELAGVALPATASGGEGAATCTWADLATSPTFVGLQVYSIDPAVPVDPVAIFADASQARTPLAIGDGGSALADVGLIPGGGGIGRSVVFRVGSLSVALGVTGEDVDAARLESVARAVADRL